jgi:hypothetical protein
VSQLIFKEFEVFFVTGRMAQKHMLFMNGNNVVKMQWDLNNVF